MAPYQLNMSSIACPTELTASLTPSAAPLDQVPGGVGGFLGEPLDIAVIQLFESRSGIVPGLAEAIADVRDGSAGILNEISKGLHKFCTTRIPFTLSLSHYAPSCNPPLMPQPSVWPAPPKVSKMPCTSPQPRRESGSG